MADPWPNIGNPGTGYLGLGPAGYYIGRYLLGGAQREEEAQQRALLDAIEVLRRTQPSMQTTWEDVPPSPIVPGREYPPLRPDLPEPRDFPPEPRSFNLSDTLFPPQAAGLPSWIEHEPTPGVLGWGYAPGEEQFALYPGEARPHKFSMAAVPEEAPAPQVETPTGMGMVKEAERAPVAVAPAAVAAPAPVAPPPAPPGAPPIPPRAPAPTRRQVTRVSPGEDLRSIAISNPALLPFMLKGLPEFQKVEAATREAQAEQAMGQALRTALAQPAPAPVAGDAQTSALLREREALRQSLAILLQNRQFLGTKAAENIVERLSKINTMLGDIEKVEAETPSKAAVAQLRQRALQEADLANRKGDTQREMEMRAIAAEPEKAASIIKEQGDRARALDRQRLFEHYAAIEEVYSKKAALDGDMVAAKRHAGMASVYRAAAVDKDSAEIVMKARDAARKEGMEGSGGVEAWKEVSNAFGDKVALELAATPGMTPERAIRDPAALRQAQANVLAQAKALAKAGVQPVAMTAAQLQEISESLVAIENFKDAEVAIAADPRGWGGPGGWVAYLDSQLARIGKSTDERVMIRNNIEQGVSAMRKATGGTALSAWELKALKWLPDPKTQSHQELLARLKATRINIARALNYRLQLHRGEVDLLDVEKFPLIATPQGDISVRTFVPSPPTGGRTQEQQNAHDRLQEFGIIPPR